VSAPALRPGTVIDGYEVVDLLGRGGMGAVYRVRRGDSELALKTLTLDASDESEEALRFRREAELLGSLRHPGLVRVSSAGHKPGFFYFIMRLIEGESLEDRLKRTGPLPEAEAVRISLAVADAIAHAHERGVIHRDLKPANVMIEKEGDRPVVMDFGLGRQLGETDAERLTKTGEILGTPAFVAPEQAFGLKSELDEKTDVYGLGALLYTMLAGQAPFDGPSALAIMKKVSTEPPPRLADVSPSLEGFVRRAMAKRREDRPPSARAFMDELRSATARAPLVSAPALAFFAFALLLLCGTILAVRAWRSAEGLSQRVATLRSQLDATPIPSARANAAKALGDVPALARRGFIRERSELARQAFAADSWREARRAALECLLATPDAPEDMEPILVASLVEIAAETGESDPPGAAKLRELARTASPAALPAAKDALCALARARAQRLVAAVDTSAKGWTSVLRHCDAALHATDSEVLPEDCEEAHVAALVLSGRRTDPDLLLRQKTASLRSPPLAFAAHALYAAALAQEGEESRLESLRKLDKIPPPPPLDAVVSEIWWHQAFTIYESSRGELLNLVYKIGLDGTSSSATNKIQTATKKATAQLKAIFDPLGRAFRAKPDREPLPRELGEFLSFVRLAANQPLLMGRGSEDYWITAVELLDSHPVALYVRGRVLGQQAKGLRESWPKGSIAELRSLAQKLLPVLQHAPPSEHVRAFAYEFVAKVLLDDPANVKSYPGALDDALPLIELGGYSEGWGVLAYAREGAGDEPGAQAARAEELRGEAIPHHLSRLPEFYTHQSQKREGPR
jgi:hypothetical protein